jgi:hypothetical protein
MDKFLKHAREVIFPGALRSWIVSVGALGTFIKADRKSEWFPLYARFSGLVWVTQVACSALLVVPCL